MFSNKEGAILLRAEHVEKMEAVRKNFNKAHAHGGQSSLTASDILAAVCDFVFEHQIPFERLQRADDVKELVREHVYHSAIFRWRQFNESF